MKKILFVIFLFCSLALSAQTVYYIDPAGVDGPSHTGSSSDPWLHLGYAATRVTTAGDKIFVKLGTYTETGRTVLYPKVSIQGASQTGCIINFTYVATSVNDACIRLYSASLEAGDQSITNLTITGSNLVATRGIWIGYRHNVDITNCTIRDFAALGVHYRNQINWLEPPSVYASGSDFRYNTVRNCGDRNLADEAGLRVDGQTDMTIAHNVFRNNERSIGHNGNCINISFIKGTTIEYNHFTKPDSEGGEWNFFAEVFHLRGGVEVRYNTFIGAATWDLGSGPSGSSTKGAYDFSYSVHHNTFETASGSMIARAGLGHDAGAIVVEGNMEYVYIYKNYIKNFAMGIESANSTTQNYTISHLYIDANVIEHFGYTDYAYTWGILIIHENNSAYTNTQDNVHLRNNTIYGGTGYNYNGIRWVSNGTATNISMKNNIIHSCDQNAIYFSKQGGESASFNVLNVTYNCFYNNGTNSVYIDPAISQTSVDLSTGNITTNPLITSSTDYHLLEGSPSIRTGTYVGILTDIEGRDYYNPPSRGAYEIAGATTVPTVTTTSITNITTITATGGGDVTFSGGAAVTARGVCWSTGENPTTANSKTENGTGTGSYTSYLINLTGGLTYYVRAYATNSNGTAYGNQGSFTASDAPPADILVKSGSEFVKSGTQLIKARQFIYLADHYVAVNGNDANPGTFEQPWTTWQKAFDNTAPGELTYIRGGTYVSSIPRPAQKSSTNGSAGNLISIFNYPGEVPELDVRSCTDDANTRGIYLYDCDYWHIKGLTVRGVQQYDSTKFVIGIYAHTCNYVTFENCTSYENEGGGIVFNLVNGGLIKNCDSYNNTDPGLYNNGNGIAIIFTAIGATNTVTGCRSWNNDGGEGFGTWGDGIITYDSCWAWNNHGRPGDGSGFELGRTYDGSPPAYTQRFVTNCIAANNDQGFNQSSADVKFEVYNNFAYNNLGYGYLFHQYAHADIIRNNTAWLNGTNKYLGGGDIEDHNSWQDGLVVNNADFVSIDLTQLDNPRKANGSLPDITTFHLVTGSDLKNAGVNVGIPYMGVAPEIGCFEFVE